MNHISEKELELVEHIRVEINAIFNRSFEKDFDKVTARKIYELMKILMTPEPQRVICPTCQKKSGAWVCPCEVCGSQDGL